MVLDYGNVSAGLGLITTIVKTIAAILTLFDGSYFLYIILNKNYFYIPVLIFRIRTYRYFQKYRYACICQSCSWGSHI